MRSIVATYPIAIRKAARAPTLAQVGAATARWESWQLRKRAQMERAWRRRIAVAFLKLKRRMDRALPGIVGRPTEVRSADPQGAMNEIILDWSETELQEVLTGLYADAYQASGLGLKMTLGAYIPLTVGGHAEAEEWAKWHAGRRVKNIDQPTRHALRDHLQEGIREGRNIHQIAYGIKAKPATETEPAREASPGIADLVEETYKKRARAIARTETGVAFNIGAHGHYTAAGVAKVRVLDGHGPGSCEACNEVNGQEWSLDRMYKEPLQHPNCIRGFSPIIAAFAEPELPEAVPIPPTLPLWAERRWAQAGEAPPFPGPLTRGTRGAGQLLWEGLYPGREAPESFSALLRGLGAPLYEDQGKLKDRIVTALSAQSGISYDEINNMVASWADTSGNASSLSVLIQNTAAKLFGVETGPYNEEKLVGLWTDPHLSLGKARTRAEGYLRAVYERTQEQLANRKVKTIRLYRGLNLPKEDLRGLSKGDLLSHTSNALSSWSLDRRTCETFARYHDPDWVGIIMHMDVPVERIVGTAATGMGCIAEKEIVLLGGLKDVARIVSWIRS